MHFSLGNTQGDSAEIRLSRKSPSADTDEGAGASDFDVVESLVILAKLQLLIIAPT